MTELKEKHIRLLKENGSVLANAILFYITNTNEELVKKKQFVEKVVAQYVTFDSISSGRYEEWVNMINIPTEIQNKLILSYKNDLLKEQQRNQNKIREDLIDEMNEIF